MRMGEYFGWKSSDLAYERDTFFDSTDAVGIEIEIEDVDRNIEVHIPNFSTYWTTSPEDSLRNNGVEYVFTSELWGKDLAAALDKMEEFFTISKKKGKIHVSKRCSIHVHVDVRGMTTEQFRNFLLVVNSVEPLLFHVSGKREGNIYCLPPFNTHNGSNLINNIFDIKDGKLGNISTEKYASYNTAPLSKQGSVEFRHHEGTDDISRVRKWVKSLINIKKYSKELDNIVNDLPAFVSKVGFVDYVQQVFLDQAESYLYPGFHLDLLKGVRSTQEGMYLSKIKAVNSNLGMDGKGSLFKNFLIKNEDKFISKNED